MQMLRTTIGWMTGSSRMVSGKKSGTVSNTVAPSESSDSIEVYMQHYEKLKQLKYLFVNLIMQYSIIY